MNTFIGIDPGNEYMKISFIRGSGTPQRVSDNQSGVSVFPYGIDKETNEFRRLRNDDFKGISSTIMNAKSRFEDKEFINETYKMAQEILDEKNMNDNIEKMCIVVPSYFNSEKQNEEFKKEVENIFNKKPLLYCEATAATYYYLNESNRLKKSESESYAVLNFGSTIEVSFVNVSKERDGHLFTVTNSYKSNFLFGKSISEFLYAKELEKFLFQNEGTDISKISPEMLNRLIEKCYKWENEDVIENFCEGKKLTIDIEDVEYDIECSINDFLNAIFNQETIKSKKIRRVIITGFVSNIEMIYEIIKDYFDGKYKCQFLNTELISQGAVLLARDSNKAKEFNSASCKEIQFRLPEILKSTIKIKDSNNKFIPIIKAYSNPPYVFTGQITPINKKEPIVFEIYEDDAIIEILIIPCADVEKIMVRVSINSYGILKVAAVDENKNLLVRSESCGSINYDKEKIKELAENNEKKRAEYEYNYYLDVLIKMHLADPENSSIKEILDNFMPTPKKEEIKNKLKKLKKSIHKKKIVE